MQLGLARDPHPGLGGQSSGYDTDDIIDESIYQLSNFLIDSLQVK